MLLLLCHQGIRQTICHVVDIEIIFDYVKSVLRRVTVINWAFGKLWIFLNVRNLALSNLNFRKCLKNRKIQEFRNICSKLSVPESRISEIFCNSIREFPNSGNSGISDINCLPSPRFSHIFLHLFRFLSPSWRAIEFWAQQWKTSFLGILPEMRILKLKVITNEFLPECLMPMLMLIPVYWHYANKQESTLIITAISVHTGAGYRLPNLRLRVPHDAGYRKKNDNAPGLSYTYFPTLDADL